MVFCTDLIQFCESCSDIFSLKTSELQEAVEIHSLEIVILGNNSADETDKAFSRTYRELRYVD